jgi:DNA-binding NarL/FixJ family response regulator
LEIIRVFIVDDHAVVRDGLRLLLEIQPDIKVIGEAADGHEALNKISHACPDIVIMDVEMPVLDGIETIRQMQSVCPAAKSIVLSMHSSEEHISQAFRAGAQGYLLKEVVGSEVVTAVRNVHAGTSYMCEKISQTIAGYYSGTKEVNEVRSQMEGLSFREHEILQLIGQGKSRAEIARILNISSKTVESYHGRLKHKLGVSDYRGLRKLAIEKFHDRIRP